jgi:putative phosphoribosyl transferase
MNPPHAHPKKLVEIPAQSTLLLGDFSVPENATGVVLFAHGSGSGRFSPRNRYVAETLQRAGFATLLLDLLTVAEERVDERTGHLRFDISFLAERLKTAIDWLQAEHELPIGLFGASTGAAAALFAAADRPEAVHAIVSRGGRPDLAQSVLHTITIPTLLIVGGSDTPVIPLNRQALAGLAAEDKILEIVPGATHLFEEPGALEEVARLSTDWFLRYLSPVAAHGH